MIRFKLQTGMTDHPGDILVNATVEVLTQQTKDELDRMSFPGKFFSSYQFYNL